jgi:hypothetical protein
LVSRQQLPETLALLLWDVAYVQCGIAGNAIVHIKRVLRDDHCRQGGD